MIFRLVCSGFLSGSRMSIFDQFFIQHECRFGSNFGSCFIQRECLFGSNFGYLFFSSSMSVCLDETTTAL